MQFKFRAIDEQASRHHPPPTGAGYFSEQALRVGYSGSDFRRMAGEQFFRNPSNMHEAIQLEIEKERIREKIIAEEIRCQQQLMEAEVRREMLLEREMALRRAGGFSFFSGSAAASTMLFQPRLPLLHQSEGRLLEERLALSREQRLVYHAHHGIEGFEMLPYHSNAEPNISEVNPPSQGNKEKIIFLPRPEEKLSRLKRQAVTPLVAGPSELPSGGGLKKKPKRDWSCAICQISATSEQVLNNHFQGKKHKAKAAAGGKSYAIGLFVKKTSEPIKLVETPDDQSSESEQKLEGESLLLQKRSKAEEDVEHNDDLELEVIEKTSDCENENEDSVQVMGESKERFDFWCEMCQVGAHSEIVMDAHKKGKKHIGRLQELDQNGGWWVSTVQVEEPEALAEDEREETLDDVDGADDGEAAENQFVVAPIN